MGQLGQHVVADEPGAAERQFGVDPELLRVGLAAADRRPGPGRRPEHRPVAARQVRRVEGPARRRVQLRVKEHPAGAVPVLDDHMVGVEPGVEVPGEADPGPGRHPPVPQRRDGEQREVTAAARHPLPDRAGTGQRRTGPARLIHRQDPVHPAQVDLREPLGGQLHPARPVVHQHVPHHRGQPPDLRRERVEQGRERPGIAVAGLLGPLVDCCHAVHALLCPWGRVKARAFRVSRRAAR